MTTYRLVDPELHSALQRGYVGVLPTDTLYGLVAHAAIPAAVERIYDIKQRDKDKPPIILVSHADIIQNFGVAPELIAKVQQYWPGALSAVFSVPDSGLDYLHRGSQSLAFRVPAEPTLRYFLEKTGPVVAPSANRQGEAPVASSEEAKAYFADAVDFYVDGGVLTGQPSTLVRVTPDGELEVLRPGAVQLIEE